MTENRLTIPEQVISDIAFAKLRARDHLIDEWSKLSRTQWLEARVFLTAKPDSFGLSRSDLERIVFSVNDVIERREEADGENRG